MTIVFRECTLHTESFPVLFMIINASKIVAVTFDFDGVLTVGGEDTKKQAWGPVVAPWPQYLQDFRLQAGQKFEHAKGSRFDVLRDTFIRAGFVEPLVSEMVAVYAEAYNTSVITLLKQSGMPPGTKELLGELSNRFPLFLNSATPEKSLLEIVGLFEIREIFNGIFGMPTTKVENLKRVQQESSCSPEQILFVGDGVGDLAAATQFGCQFVGIPKSWNGWKVGEVPFPLISVVTELPTLMQ